MPVTRDQIRAYYDQNTRLCLAFNRCRKAENIHRSLWTNDTKTLEEALNQVNDYILKEIETVAPGFVAIALLFVDNVLPIRHAILPAMLGSLGLQKCLFMNV